MYAQITTSPSGPYIDARLEDLNQVVKDMLENQNIDVVRWVPNNCELIKEELELILQMVITTTYGGGTPIGPAALGPPT